MKEIVGGDIIPAENRLLYGITMKAPLCSVVRVVFPNATLLLAFVNAKAVKLFMWIKMYLRSVLLFVP